MELMRNVLRSHKSYIWLVDCFVSKLPSHELFTQTNLEVIARIYTSDHQGFSIDDLLYVPTLLSVQ
jgi:hypothetical protein